MRLHDMQYTDTKGYEVAMDSSANMVDESFMLQFSSISLDQVKYEPNELDLLPERRSAKRSIRCDPALDQEMQYCLEDAASKNTESRDSVTDTKHGLTADRKLKFISEASNKRSTWGPKSKGKLSKMSPPIDDARVRAERIRIYKTDLQKLKKEKVLIQCSVGHHFMLVSNYYEFDLFDFLLYSKNVYFLCRKSWRKKESKV